MVENMSLWDRWKIRLDDLDSGNRGFYNMNIGIDHVNKYLTETVKKDLDAKVDQIVQFVKENYEPKNARNADRVVGDLNDIGIRLKEFLRLQEAEKIHRTLKINKLKDYRAQEDRADFLEKVRFLIFRMLLGLGLAAVLLGTYWLAAPERLDIHLPMAPRILAN